MVEVEIYVKKLCEGAKLPEYAHPGDAGLDLFSCEDVILEPKQRRAIGTGIAIGFPKDYVALIWDKGGLANNHGISTMAGVFEYTYRGEYMVVLRNTSDEEFRINKGDKIAQLLIQPIVTAKVKEVKELSETVRGEGRFGSTGKR